ncbi:hypothetical protein T07_2046 [Trichinella nelsoni]|uniref:Uncharacterized protein n=1 Tax=Trichinella nelsoni TaxID=6336 RepID=A0A0V0RLV9_9BILA|nr:hypothetical protein T07_2046 [Trichinella nelsoni]
MCDAPHLNLQYDPPSIPYHLLPVSVSIMSIVRNSFFHSFSIIFYICGGNSASGSFRQTYVDLVSSPMNIS